ncbi:MAG: hypothetical protein ACRDCJ_00265 [Metamycoplasmataceae bacterium]
MNIFLDTTQYEFVGCLFDDNFNIKTKTIVKTVYKVEEVTKFFDALLIDMNVDIKDIKNFYINIGPGSFTGSRIALIYTRTISQITGASIFTTNSFKLLDSKSDDQLFIAANKNNSFMISLNNIEHVSKTKLVEKTNKEKTIDYNKLLSSFNDYINLFQLETDILKIKPEYGSTPQIGRAK